MTDKINSFSYRKKNGDQYPRIAAAGIQRGGADQPRFDQWGANHRDHFH